MKKLMIGAAIVCAAVGIQAAQFDWSFEADDVMGSYTVANDATYYMISGASGIGDTLATILKDDGVDAFTTALAGYSYNTGTLTGGTVAGRVENTGANTYAALFIINDGLVGGADFAYNEYVVSGNIYEPPSSKAPLTAYASDYGDSDYAAAWGAGTAKAVPEPTSGLLLLLGVAGLALRRKQA